MSAIPLIQRNGRTVIPIIDFADDDQFETYLRATTTLSETLQDDFPTGYIVAFAVLDTVSTHARLHHLLTTYLSAIDLILLSCRAWWGTASENPYAILKSPRSYCELRRVTNGFVVTAESGERIISKSSPEAAAAVGLICDCMDIEGVISSGQLGEDYMEDLREAYEAFHYAVQTGDVHQRLVQQIEAARTHKSE